MIVVVAKIHFNSQEDRDRAVELSVPIQQATRDDEPGCHDYCFMADPCVATMMQVYELWEDSDSLVAHFDHPNYTAMLTMFGEIGIADAETRAYLTERSESVYAEDGSKKTVFFP